MQYNYLKILYLKNNSFIEEQQNAHVYSNLKDNKALTF